MSRKKIEKKKTKIRRPFPRPLTSNLYFQIEMLNLLFFICKNNKNDNKLIDKIMFFTIMEQIR